MVTTEYVPDTGQIVWLQFSPQTGHEQLGHLPALVLSPSNYNEKSGLGVFCPITSRSKGYPFEVQLPDSHSTNGVILADQVRSLDWRARQAKFIEETSPRVLAEVNGKLSVLLTQNNLNTTWTISKSLEELLASTESFLNAFELVFDLDWDMTKNCIADSGYLISESGTFLRPMVNDESNNWANRGSLLEEYRNLRNRTSTISELQHD